MWVFDVCRNRKKKKNDNNAFSAKGKNGSPVGALVAGVKEPAKPESTMNTCPECPRGYMALL